MTAYNIIDQRFIRIGLTENNFKKYKQSYKDVKTGKTNMEIDGFV